MLAPATLVKDSMLEDQKFAKYFLDSESAQNFASSLLGQELGAEPYIVS